MGFKRALLERSLKTEEIFADPYKVMDLSENFKIIRDGFQAAAAAAANVNAPDSLKQFSDFSINRILNSGSCSNNSSDNEDLSENKAINRTSVTRTSLMKSVELTGMDLSNHLQGAGKSQGTIPLSIATPSEPLRPLNRAFDSPWSSKGPVMFTPKLNSLPSNYYEAISQTLITVHQSAQNYPFPFNHPGSGLPLAHSVNNLHLNPHLLYHHPHSAMLGGSRGVSSSSSSSLKSNGDLIMPPTTKMMARDLDYCYMPTPSSAAALTTAATTTPQLPPSNESSSSSSPAYNNCPCKQCELRSLSLNSVAPSVDDEATAAATAAALFNLKSRYECEECGKGFSQLRNYKYHLSIHKGTREFAANCPECGKIFNDKGYLSSHLKIHRNRKEYVCPHCPKSFNQRVAFNMHVRIHTGIKPHTCPQCSKRFSRKMLLKQHLRTHTGEKPYQCTICSKTFADRSNMTLHQRLHSGKRIAELVLKIKIN